MTEQQTLPGEWETTFFDFTDANGERFGVVERRRLVAEVPCIGCRLRLTNPDMAVRRSYEVEANGEPEGIEDEGCHCDQQEEAGYPPWRDTIHGTRLPRQRCRRCGGMKHVYSRREPGKRRTCPDCEGSGWVWQSAETVQELR